MLDEDGSPGGPPRKTPPGVFRAARAYLVFLCFFGLLVRLVAEGQWWATLFLYAPQALYAAPLPILLLAAAWKRERKALLPITAAAAVVVGPLMGFNAPVSRLLPRPRPAGRVRVMEYNLESCRRGSAPVVRQVMKFRPDVVVFCEMPEASGGLQLLADLERARPGWTSLQDGEVCLMSRWPVLQREFEPLRSPTPGRSYRDKVRLRIRGPAGPFWLAGAHFNTALHGQTVRSERGRLPSYLERTAAVRREQAADVLHWMSGLPDPVLLAGDFNTPPAGRVYGALCRAYGDSFTEAGWGWGFTYPSRLPLLRIDYVFHSPEFRAVSARVGDARGSDHRPLFVELERGG